MRFTEFISEDANPKRQAAIAIAMKKAGKKPKGMAEGLENIGKMSSLVDLPVFGGNGISKVAITGDGRITAVVNVRGVNVPFYISTGEGGKLSVPTGMWYPFFGSGPSGYLNKGTEDSINKFYGSKVFERYASLLNRELGNLMTVQKQIPPMKKEGRSIINKDMSPMDHAEIEANPEEFKKRVNAFLAKIGDKPFYTVNTAKQTDTQGVAEGENWSKHNNKRAGGMSKKSVSVYRREHPGSKIQTAVTTKPSKLKKGSKAAKRRASFCARMRGMKKHRTGAKTAHDPNSNINKSLRRWHCESIEELHELVMLAEQYIRNNKK